MTYVEVTPYVNAPAEQLARRAFGNATIVLSSERRGHLWVARQRSSKEITKRQAGTLDIFTETAVVGPNGMETPRDNRIASLAEMVDNTGVRDVGRNFHLVDQNDTFLESQSTPGILYRSAIVVFDGAVDYPFAPAAEDEVEPAMLVPITEVTDPLNQSVRPLAQEIVQRAVTLGVIDEAYRRYDRGDHVPAFPNGFTDIEEFQRHRDLLTDCVIFDSASLLTN